MQIIRTTINLSSINVSVKKIFENSETKKFEPPFADEQQLYRLKLRRGKKFCYVFDFCDDHEFEVTVQSITNSVEAPGPYPKILSMTKKRLRQYR